MQDQIETPLTELKAVRRSFIAGLAGLGAAAMMKLSGAGKAEANGETMIVGATFDPSTGHFYASAIQQAHPPKRAKQGGRFGRQ